jgi:hypothetical protein
MHDLKFGLATTKVNKAYQHHHKSVINPQLAEVAKTFELSISQLVWMAALPAFAAMNGEVEGVAHHKAPSKFGESWITMSKKAKEDAMKSARENTTHVFQRIGSTSVEWNNAQETLSRMSKVHEYLASFGRGMHFILMAQITGAWSAFEVLAKDAWIVAVNAKPDVFATRAIDEMLPNQNGKRQRTIPRISYDYLKQIKFNLDGKLGTVLADESSLNFQLLGGIKDAYVDVFREQKAKILAIFADKNLRLLSATRNIIAHKAGAVDQKFLSDIEGLPKLFGNPIVGESLLLDGEISSELVNASIDNGHKIINLIQGILLMR